MARHLARAGVRVRGLTRRADASGSAALRSLGIEPTRADMDDVASLREAFAGVDAVYSVQNGMVAGFDREAVQGRNVGDAALAAGVRHIVYGSAGPGHGPTGVPSWDVKRGIEEHLRGLGLPYTILRPTAFMELMTDRAFYPAVGTWRIWPRVMGADRPVPWLAVDDLGAIAAKVFGDPGRFAGVEVELAGDVRTLEQCRADYRDVAGREPKTMPMPMWLFDRFTRKDVTTMWRWARNGDLPLDTAPAQSIIAKTTTVREWLQRTLGPGGGPDDNGRTDR